MAWAVKNAQPEEIAVPGRFLVSARANFVIGIVQVVHGGGAASDRYFLTAPITWLR
jgi:hypothetical protein